MGNPGSGGTNVRGTDLSSSRCSCKPDADPAWCAYVSGGRNPTSQAGLREFDRTHRDFWEGIGKSRDPFRPAWTAVVHMTIHKSGNQRSSPAVNNSDTRPV